ncbi:MAG: hypothetical protein KAG84_00220 [Bacteroidales bacterium]|nr:hypothetical protein [Bacteroidales bacterium]
MNNDNNIIKKLKNGMMFSCDTATLLITKREHTKLTILDGLRLQMHLASCKFCRRFDEQSKEISAQIKDFSNLKSNNPIHKLSEEQKNNLSDIIDSK